jgi:hypothetical protein
MKIGNERVVGRRKFVNIPLLPNEVIQFAPDRERERERVCDEQNYFHKLNLYQFGCARVSELSRIMFVVVSYSFSFPVA